MLRELRRAGDNGTGWVGSMALFPFYKHKCPLTVTIKSEGHSFSEMPQEQIWEGKDMHNLQENQWINPQFLQKIAMWLNNATTTCKLALLE